MNRRTVWVVAGLTVVAVVAIFLLVRVNSPPVAGAVSDENTSAATDGASVAADAPLAAGRLRPGANRFDTVQSISKPESADAAEPGGSAATQEDGDETMFRADASGRLIVDEQTRLDIEKLVALNDPPEVQHQLQELARTLPPAAAQQLPDLVERYRNYEAALRQIVPPGQALSSAQEAVTMLESMHALRVQYFGAEVAKGFFAAEEKAQRQMIELMRLDNDQSLTLQEKAEKAQALYEAEMPEIKGREGGGGR